MSGKKPLKVETRERIGLTDVLDRPHKVAHEWACPRCGIVNHPTRCSCLNCRRLREGVAP